jgi:hypothetical protein
MFQHNSQKHQQEGSKTLFKIPSNLNFSSKENLKLGESNSVKEESKIKFSNSNNTNPFLNFKENKTPLLNFKFRERENDKTSPTKLNFSREFRTREATEIQESSDKINCSKTEVKIKLNFDEEIRNNMFSVTSKKSRDTTSCYKKIFKKENLFLEKENICLESEKKLSLNFENSSKAQLQVHKSQDSKNMDCLIDFGLKIDNKKPSLSLSDSRSVMSNFSKRSKVGGENSVSMQNLNVQNIQNNFLNISNVSNNLNSNSNFFSVNNSQICNNNFVKPESISSKSLSNPFDKSFCLSGPLSVSSLNSMNSNFSNFLNSSFNSNGAYNGQPISLGSENQTLSSMSPFSYFTGSLSGFSSVYSDYSSCNESNTTNFTSNERARSFFSFNQSVSQFSSTGNSQNLISHNNISNGLDNVNYFKIPELENETEDSNYNSRESISSSGINESNEHSLQEYERNLLIPIEKKNDEKYKILKINKTVRKIQVPPNKSVRKWDEFKTHDNGDCDDSKFL